MYLTEVYRITSNYKTLIYFNIIDFIDQTIFITLMRTKNYLMSIVQSLNQLARCLEYHRIYSRKFDATRLEMGHIHVNSSVSIK